MAALPRGKAIPTFPRDESERESPFVSLILRSISLTNFLGFDHSASQHHKISIAILYRILMPLTIAILKITFQH